MLAATTLRGGEWHTSCNPSSPLESARLVHAVFPPAESLLPSRCPDLRCLSISGQSPHAPIQVYDEALTAVARLTQLCSLRMVPVTMSRGSLWRLRDMPALRTLHLGE